MGRLKGTLYNPNLSSQELSVLSQILYKNLAESKRSDVYASVKEVLSLIGMGSLLVCSVIAPGTARLFKLFTPSNRNWKKYNRSYLLRALISLQRQKLIIINRVESDRYEVVISENGKRAVLSSSLENINIPKRSVWDGQWYFVSYDIPKGHDYLRDQIRKHLDKMGFYPFQKSIYLFPYPCEREIEFLRQLLGIGEYVRVIRASRIENDKVFRDYFGV